MEYFTDGCAAQYKNCKSFYNLSNHVNDFGVDASWSFFATSHGKSPCDGIGGTVKRATANESLRRPLRNQITTVPKMLEFCSSKMPSIIFQQLLTDDIDEVRDDLKVRFDLAKTIKGTRGFHFFKPLSNNRLGMKRLSSDDDVFDFIINISSSHSDVRICDLHEITVGKFVAAVYDDKWYIGMVETVELENEDFLINFMLPNGPARSFHWPTAKDLCWVPLRHILCTIPVPSLTTGQGRQYVISDNSKTHIMAMLDEQGL